MIHNFLKCDHPGRMSGDQRREQILQTAVSLFSVRGFSGTTTKEIATAAGVSEAMVFKHFASKDALFAAILEAKMCNEGLHSFPWETNEALIAAMKAKDDFTVFYEFGRQSMDKHQSDIGFMRLLFYSSLEGHELAERFFGEFVTKIYDFLGAYLKERQADGAMRSMDTKIVVRAFLGMLIHHSLNNILWDRKRRILDISNETAARSFAEMILCGTLKKCGDEAA